MTVLLEIFIHSLCCVCIQFVSMEALCRVVQIPNDKCAVVIALFHVKVGEAMTPSRHD